MKFNKKVLVTIIALLAAAAGWYGYHLFNKPVASLTNTTTDLQIQASILLADYQVNEVNADISYLDKVIEVEGIIQKIEIEDGISIHLETADEFSRVICKLDPSYKSVTYKAGDPVIIKGLCTGYLMDVILVNSTIINKN